jgi:hypothetical protein
MAKIKRKRKRETKSSKTRSKPEVIYLEKAFRKITSWVDMCPDEISGYGTVKIIDGAFVVTDAFLLEQEVTGTTTELDAMATAKLMDEIDSKSEEEKEELGELRLWWHSHVNMDVFWSTTDEEAVETISGNPYFLSSVFNKRGEVKTRLDSFAVPYQMTVDDIPYKVESDDSYASVIAELMRKKGWNKLDESEEEMRDRILDCIDDVYEELSICKEEYEDKVNVKTYSYMKGPKTYIGKGAHKFDWTRHYSAGAGDHEEDWLDFLDDKEEDEANEKKPKRIAGFTPRRTRSSTSLDHKTFHLERQMKRDIKSKRQESANALCGVLAEEKRVIKSVSKGDITTEEKDDKLDDLMEVKRKVCNRLILWASEEQETDYIMAGAEEIDIGMANDWNNQRWDMINNIIEIYEIDYSDDEESIYLESEVVEINKEQKEKR